MFLENTIHHTGEHFGWIEVICGSMFSGKTEELIRRLRRAQFAKQKVEIFKPSFDTRYDDTNIVSHNANEIPSTPVEAATQILLLADGCDVVGSFIGKMRRRSPYLFDGTTSVVPQSEQKRLWELGKHAEVQHGSKGQ